MSRQNDRKLVTRPVTHWLVLAVALVAGWSSTPPARAADPTLQAARVADPTPTVGAHTPSRVGSRSDMGRARLEARAETPSASSLPWPPASICSRSVMSTPKIRTVAATTFSATPAFRCLTIRSVRSRSSMGSRNASPTSSEPRPPV